MRSNAARLGALLAAPALLALLATPARAGVGKWTGGTGPGFENSGPVAVAPVAPFTLAVTHASLGLLRTSTNGGASWASRYGDLPSTAPAGVAFAGGGSTVLYYAAESDGVFRSTDGGASWAAAGLDGTASFSYLCACWSNPLRAFAGTPYPRRTTDGGATWQTSLSEGASAAVIDPTNASVVYFATNYSGRPHSRLYRSTNGGDTFTGTGTGLEWGAGALAIDPVTPATLYAGTPYGVQKSTNSGASWGAAAGPTGITSLIVDPVAPANLLAGTPTGLHRSTDGGATWTKAAALYDLPIRSVAVDRSGTARFLAATGDGLFRTTDGGSTWLRVNTYMRGEVNALAPRDNSLYAVYAGTPGGLFVTSDDGKSWTQLGLDSGLGTEVTGVATRLAPFTLLVSTGKGLYRSTNGATFSPVAGPPFAYRVVRDEPGNRFLLFTASGLYWSQDGVDYGGPTAGSLARAVCHDSGIKSGVLTAYAVDDQGTVFRSLDQGHTYTPTPAQLPGGEKALHVAARHDDPSRVYASTANRLYRSTDSGTSWAWASSTWPIEELLVDEVIADGVVTATKNGIVASEDGGAHWTRIDDGLWAPVMTMVKSLVPSRLNPRKLFAGMVTGGVYSDLAVDRNQVLNGDFTQKLAAWTFNAWTPGGWFGYSGADANGDSTSYSMVIQGNGGQGTSEGATQPCTQVLAADRYAMGLASFVTSSQVTVKMTVRWYLDGACAGDVLRTDQTAPLTPGAGWTRASTWGIYPPNGARTARIDLVVTNTSSTATIFNAYLDDVFFEASPHGDVNGDWTVNVSDVLFLINYLFAGGPAPWGNGDVDGDGVVTVGDVLFLINYLFAGGLAPI